MPRFANHLHPKQLACLFAQLARLEASGIPVVQVLQILAQSDAKLRDPILLMQSYLKSGLAIANAGFKAGLFDETQKTLIHAAEHSGQLDQIYAQLADHYRRQHMRNQKIKSRLYLPMLTAILALFINSMPALVSGNITVFEYMQFSLGRLMLAGFGIFLLINLPSITRYLGIEKAWHRLQLGFPVFGKWVLRRQLNEFFFILALMLESGLTFADAFPKALATIKNSTLRGCFKPALLMIGSGLTVSETLAKVPIIDKTMLNTVNSSEQSGKLPVGLLHFVKLEAETIALYDEALADWIPRLVYVLIVIWVAVSMIGGSFLTLI